MTNHPNRISDRRAIEIARNALPAELTEIKLTIHRGTSGDRAVQISGCALDDALAAARIICDALPTARPKVVSSAGFVAVWL